MLLGEGRLTWNRYERVGDRYGTVFLMNSGDSLNPPTNPYGYLTITDAPVGQHGQLVVEVLDTRHSAHIGDLFRGLFPSTPEVGERIVLGSGTLFSEEEDFGATSVGLEPDDGRETDWLDPKMLYRAHEQTVRLLFEPDTGQ